MGNLWSSSQRSSRRRSSSVTTRSSSHCLLTFHKSFLKYEIRREQRRSGGNEGKEVYELDEPTLEELLECTIFRPRYIGFLQCIDAVADAAVNETLNSDIYNEDGGLSIVRAFNYHRRERLFLVASRLYYVIGIAPTNSLYYVLGQLAEHRALQPLVGSTFSAISAVALILIMMSRKKYTMTATGFDVPYGQGFVFGALLSLQRCMLTLKKVMDSGEYNSIYLSDLYRYIDAFGTALLRVLWMHEDSIRTEMLDKLDMIEQGVIIADNIDYDDEDDYADDDDDDGNDTASSVKLERIRVATMYALLQCAYDVKTCMPTGYCCNIDEEEKQSATHTMTLSDLCYNRYKMMLDYLLRYKSITREHMELTGVLDTHVHPWRICPYTCTKIIENLCTDCKPSVYEEVDLIDLEMRPFEDDNSHAEKRSTLLLIAGGLIHLGEVIGKILVWL